MPLTSNPTLYYTGRSLIFIFSTDDKAKVFLHVPQCVCFSHKCWVTKKLPPNPLPPLSNCRAHCGSTAQKVCLPLNQTHIKVTFIKQKDQQHNVDSVHFIVWITERMWIAAIKKLKSRHNVWLPKAEFLGFFFVLLASVPRLVAVNISWELNSSIQERVIILFFLISSY